jgi:hypothetical protein
MVASSCRQAELANLIFEQAGYRLMPRRMRTSKLQPPPAENSDQADTAPSDNGPKLNTAQIARLLGVSESTVVATAGDIRLSHALSGKAYRLTLGLALTMDTRGQHSLMTAFGNYLVARSMFERTLIDRETYQDLEINFVLALARVRDMSIFQPILDAMRMDYSEQVDSIFRQVMDQD